MLPCGIHSTFLSNSTQCRLYSHGEAHAADHCDRLMSWRVPREEHEHVSETGVFPSLDRVSGTLCLLHYVTETSQLYSLRDFWRHFCLSRVAAHSDCCFFAPCTHIRTYLLTCPNVLDTNSLVGGQFLIYPVTWTTAYCWPSLDGPRALRRRARTGCDGDDIGSTATSPRRMRMIKPRREPMHSLRFAVNDITMSSLCFKPQQTAKRKWCFYRPD